MLDSGFLQNKSDIAKVPRDGFCLLHALCLSLKSQFPSTHEFQINELISLMKPEAISHEVYLPAFENSLDSLKIGLYRYVYSRVYDSNFGDIVPLLLANSLGVDICILYHSENVLKSSIIDCLRDVVRSCLYI